MNIREILCVLSYKKEGKYDQIYEALVKKEKIDDKEVENILSLISTDYMTILDSDYPDFFKKCIQKPPFVLYYKGDINLLTKTDPRNFVSVVGSRKSTFYGESAVRNIIKDLPKDVVIVSGMAKGIDAASHRAALDFSLKTIAVLGSGIDYVYPKENEDLYNRIIQNGGLIISEYPNSIEPTPDKFIFRNRLVASIGSFLLVGEAYERSGTSITVNYALNAGKSIGCIPYPATCKSACNGLIKDGAALIETSDDLLIQLGRDFSYDNKKRKKRKN